MTEGTKSYLIGCHQFLLHPVFVIMAWRLEYKSWPKLWQIVCIFLHDIGICGRQYLSDDTAKNGHWGRGARLTYIWLGIKAYSFCAGHTQESKCPESALARADKRSWVVAPMWWLWWNYWVEWSGKGIGVTPPPLWKKLVAENLKRERPLDSHELYIKNRR